MTCEWYQNLWLEVRFWVQERRTQTRRVLVNIQKSFFFVKKLKFWSKKNETCQKLKILRFHFFIEFLTKISNVDHEGSCLFGCIPVLFPRDCL